MAYLYEDSEWSFKNIQKVYDAIEQIAVEELKLDCYPNQIEVISSQQMLEAYASNGMPIFYQHWSFGKHFALQEEAYKKGRAGLAYEIVINSSPARAYLMEENTMTMQTLVIAHASFGHNFFFKNNYLFKQWTDAESIIDYLTFAKNYINNCEQKYGFERVESLLDSCHALMDHGVDRFKRTPELTPELQEKRRKERDEYTSSQLNDLWRTIPNKKKKKQLDDKKFPEHPEENLLYFIEKYAPNLEQWEREIVRIVRNIAQYWYPQKQTKIANEGTACFVHYYIMTRLDEKNLLPPGAFMEFLSSHTAVCMQQDFSNNINPYALGFNIFMDIKRISENPTEEDKLWFPDIAGGDWLKNIHFAMKNFRDDSLIKQYLSPHLIRKFRMFILDDVEKQPEFTVERIHNERGYKKTRDILSRNNDLQYIEPDIQIIDVDLEGDRSILLHHYQKDQIPLSEKSCLQTLKHFRKLWGYKTILKTIHDGVTREQHVVDIVDGKS